MSIPCIRPATAALLLTLALAGPAVAGAPTDALRDYIDRALALAGESRRSDESRASGARHARERLRDLRALAHEAVDFSVAARRSLGSHWNARTQEERLHFVEVFTALIDHTYLTNLPFDGVRIAYDGEQTNGRTAEVRARAFRKGDVTPVIFSLHQDGGARWRIVDVSFEGMSLVGLYRAQFNKILRTSSYDAMVSRLQERTRAAIQESGTTDTSAGSGAP